MIKIIFVVDIFFILSTEKKEQLRQIENSTNESSSDATAKLLFTKKYLHDKVFTVADSDSCFTVNDRHPKRFGLIPFCYMCLLFFFT